MVYCRRTLGLIALGVLAFALRVWVVMALTTDHAAPLTYEHGKIAENILAGQGFSVELLGGSGATSQQAPFYPLLLTAVYFIFGAGTPAAILSVQLLQCLAGTALVLVVAWLGWSLVPQRPSIGWVAALGAAIYPTHLYMVTHLQVAVWAALLLTLLLAVVVSPRWQGRFSGAILAGALAGILLLVEPILAVALPICAVVYWLAEGTGTWKSRFGRDPLARLAVMVGVAALMIAPWIVRNHLVHGRPIFIKSTFGYALWQGNNPISHGTDKIPKASADHLRRGHNGTLASMDRALWEARHETLYVDDVLLTEADYRELGQLTEPDRSAALGRRAWQFIRDNPTRYLGLCVNRLRYFLLFDETNPKAANRIYRFSTVTWLVLSLMGLAVSRKFWRSLWPTYAIFAAVLLFHSLVIVSARFRIPVEPITFIWGAMVVAPLVARIVPRREIRVVRPGALSRDPFGEDHLLKGPHFNLPARRRAG